MELKAVDATETYTLVHYDFLFVGGVSRTLSLVEGKDTIKVEPNGDLTIFQAESGTELSVNPEHLMMLASRRQTITKRVKDPNECRVCSTQAIGFTGLCALHGGS